MATKFNIILTPGPHKHFSKRGNGDDGGVIVVKGGGEKELPLPTADDLAKKVNKRVPRSRRTSQSRKVPGNVKRIITDLNREAGNRPTSTRSLKAAETQPDDAIIIAAATVVQGLMADGAYDGLMDELFGNMLRSAARAQTNPRLAKLAPVMQDHSNAVRKLRSTVATALPKIMADLRENNPDVPDAQLLAHAIQGVYKQIGPYVQVLELYTTALDQYADGEDAEQLQVINSFMESTYALTLTGDLDAIAQGKPAPQRIPTKSLQIGDLILTGFIGQRGGLGTIPGTKGPVGCHLLMVPPDMKKSSPVNYPVLTHESGHQCPSGEVDGFHEEQIVIVKNAIKAALAGGLKLSRDTVKIGEQDVPLGDLLIKLFTDWVEESTADCRGLLGHGVAFALNGLFLFPAFNPTPVAEQKKKLRSGSIFSLRKVRGGVALEFEPHPIDVARLYGLNADVLDLLGLKENAKFVRAQALAAVGGKLQDVFTFRSEDEEDQTVIQIPAVDVIALGPVVAKAIIDTKMQTLNGECLRCIVTWDQHRENKALAIAAALLRGESKIPTELEPGKPMGSVFRPYVASGAVWALWKQAEKDAANGKTVSKEFMAKLQENVTAMMKECRA